MIRKVFLGILALLAFPVSAFAATCITASECYQECAGDNPTPVTEQMCRTSCAISNGSCPGRSDFTGDHVADYAVYRRQNGRKSKWLISSGENAPVIFEFGGKHELPLTGDIDGDHKLDLVTWKKISRQFDICFSSLNYNCRRHHPIQWGKSGDFPLVADFDGDGKDDLAVYRPRERVRRSWVEGQWIIRRSTNGRKLAFTWGAATDIPVPGDIDRDGTADIIVWTPSTGTWNALISSRNFATSQRLTAQLGALGDHPLVNRGNIAVWRPTDGSWFECDVWHSSCIETTAAITLGSAGDVPVTGDQGFADYAVYHPATSSFISAQSGNSPVVEFQLGQVGDIPVYSDELSLIERLINWR